MKGRLLIVFHTKYGYTKRYVDILGNALGCDAVALEYLKADMLAEYDRVLYIAGVRGSTLTGIKKFAPFIELIYKKLTICAIGALPFKEFRPARIRETSISVLYEKFVPMFYAQSGIDINELTKIDKMSISTRVRQLQMSQNALDDDDTFFVNALESPVDEVKQANIQPLIDYLDGKEVDESLYAPAEITDEEGEKQFREEMEAASKAPENKARALKKKLKR